LPTIINDIGGLKVPLSLIKTYKSKKPIPDIVEN
jgi:hypothetical protein